MFFSPLFKDEEDIKKLDLASSKSTLPKSVQDLICMIFDVEQMKKAMLEFEVKPIYSCSNFFADHPVSGVYQRNCFFLLLM